MSDKINSVWYCRKRTLFGLPLSFTKYYLTEEKFITRTGFFSTKEEEVRLYRILDVTLRRTLGEKLFKLGSVHVCSADKSTPEFTVKRVKKSRDFKELLSQLVEAERARKLVSSREFIGDEIDEHGH